MYKRNCEIKPGILFPEGMQRVALGLEYDGAGFNGFQKQATSANTVQQVLEKALSQIANEDVTTVCAGRTDAGVHASEQVIHFDTLALRQPKAWIHGVNTLLPDSIRVHWAQAISPDFHARFCALARTYRYVIYSAPTRSACLNKGVTWTAWSLDVDKMRAAAQHLLGEHDFSSYRSAQCQAASPLREVKAVELYYCGGLLVFEITANAFLHHMVRNIVGNLLEVGRGAKPVSWLNDLLQLKDRNLGAATAKPWGLYLVKVTYPPQFNLPALPCGPIFIAR